MKHDELIISHLTLWKLVDKIFKDVLPLVEFKALKFELS